MSRKFWAAVAAFLMSISTSIAGMSSNNEKIVIFGTICSVVSAAIYMASEAYTDAARALGEEAAKKEEVKALEPCIGFEVSGEEGDD